MKKTSIIAVAGVIASLGAYAGPNNNSMMEVVTIEQVRTMNDNSPVIIRGYLLRKNGETSYVFQDTTGTINLEIDEEDWGNNTFSPNDYVEVWGEVDRNGTSMIEIVKTGRRFLLYKGEYRTGCNYKNICKTVVNQNVYLIFLLNNCFSVN